MVTTTIDLSVVIASKKVTIFYKAGGNRNWYSGRFLPCKDTEYATQDDLLQWRRKCGNLPIAVLSAAQGYHLLYGDSIRVYVELVREGESDCHSDDSYYGDLISSLREWSDDVSGSDSR